jgi:hypothetical protein
VFRDHDKTSGPSADVFEPENLLSSPYQIMPVGRTEPDEYDSVVSTRRKFSFVGEIEILRNQETSFALRHISDAIIV